MNKINIPYFITILCFGGSITSRAQSAEAQQKVGAVDLLFENFKSPRHRNQEKSDNSSAGEVSRKQIDANAPTVGELDPSLNIQIDTIPGDVPTTVVQPHGKILVGGLFNFSFVNSQSGSDSSNGIARLNADGSRDTTFVPATTSDFNTRRVTEVSALALAADGKILIGGRIYTGSSTTAAAVARLN